MTDNRDELMATFAPGADWDEEAHVRLLRGNGGASSGYTADLIEKLHSALRSAAELSLQAADALIAASKSEVDHG